MTIYHFLLVFYSELRSRWNHRWVVSHQVRRTTIPTRRVLQGTTLEQSRLLCSVAKNWVCFCCGYMLKVKLASHPSDFQHTTTTTTTTTLRPPGLYPGLHGWAGTRKVKSGRYNQSGLTGARDSEWQWHQLGHMQICTSSQTHNHASIPPLT